MSATSTGASPPDAATAEAYALCRAIARREAKNFYWAFRVLPRHKSNAMCAIYAFMRRADDIADDESKSLPARRAEMATWLASWRTSRTAAQQPVSPPPGAPCLEEMWDQRLAQSSPAFEVPSSDAPVFLALAHTQQRFSIPDSLLEELVAGTTMDLAPALAPALEPGTSNLEPVHTYPTFDDLYRYCYLVASVVGLVSIRVFGYSDARAEALAEETGVAFQLTNILRDVKEDIERNRIYLPLDLLDEFGETIPELHSLAQGRAMSERERGMLATLAIRAEKYYVSGRRLIPLLDRDSRAAMWVLITIYHRLLGQIAARRMEVFSERASVSTPAKLSILARGLAMAAWNRIIP